MAKQQSPQERIARALCKLLDDDWRDGKAFYMRRATEMLAETAHGDLLDALRNALPAIEEASTIGYGSQILDDARAAISRAS